MSYLYCRSVMTRLTVHNSIYSLLFALVSVGGLYTLHDHTFDQSHRVSTEQKDTTKRLIVIGGFNNNISYFVCF